LSTHTTAHHFLEGLSDAGIEYLFCNLGTDHASLIEELAQRDSGGRNYPKVVLCPHENVAIHMAGGYAAMTGRGQGVLVHVDAGTANAAMGMHNLARGRLPVMLMAGKSPHTLRGELPGSRDNYVHFVQDPFDMASVVRPYVKWEHSLASGVNAREVVRRGHAMMQSDPPGPVYLTLPREALAESWEEGRVRSFAGDRYGAVAAGGITPQAAAQIADMLLAAKNPVVITAYLGRKAQAVLALEELARECGIAVVEFASTHLCIPRSSPCFAGFDPARVLADADLGLLLDVDVPWLPKYVEENPATRWVQVDVDAIKKDFPMWGFAADVRHQADCATVLPQVLAAVRERATPAQRAAVAQRMVKLEESRVRREQAWADMGADPGTRDALSAPAVCAALGRAIKPGDIVVNEAIRNAPAVLTQIPRSEPLSLLGAAGAGLGYSGGMALGARLAHPGRRVINVVGDGGFHFSTPTSVYAVAQQYVLPIFTLVLDNGGWQAVKEATLRVHPDGHAAAANQFQARLGGPMRRFDQVAAAFGAYGETVNEPDDVEAAIARCLAANERGQAAVLVAKIKPF
jgi:acetolactate synthase-1/2/3 large subunit